MRPRHRRPPRPLSLGDRISAALRIGAWTVLTASLIAFAVQIGSRRSPGMVLGRDAVAYNLVFLAAAALCWLAGVRRRQRLPWGLVAIALVLSAAANLAFTLGLPSPWPSAAPTPADVLYLTYYPLMDIAAVEFIRRRMTLPPAGFWLDGLVVGLGFSALAAAFVLDPLLRGSDEADAVRAAIDVSFPVGDLTLLVVVGIFSASGTLRAGAGGRWFVAGLVLNLVTDIVYLLLDLRGEYVEGGPLDVGWLLPCAFFALAAWAPDPTRQHPSRESHRTGEPGMVRAIGLPAAANVAAVGVLVVGTVGTLSVVANGLAAACAVTAIVRTVITLHALRALPLARREALTDPLTGLGNRRHLDLVVPRLLAEHHAVAVLLVDLDDFKMINDRFGHSGGDRVLVEFATRLADCMRSSDVLARIGGDEFIAVLPSTTYTDAERLAALLCQRLTAPIGLPPDPHGMPRRIRVAASIGISTSPPTSHSLAELTEAADRAMYGSKARRRHDRGRRDCTLMPSAPGIVATAP